MASGWKLLRQVSSNPTQPVLLLKYEFGNSSYKIWLTDLTHIWVEELKQRPLIQRAWDIDSDIDPVESDQRQMLLRHIQDSLDEKSGTKIALSSDQGSRGILLTTYSPLPKPLQPVRWPIHLTPASQSSLTNELLLPLLAEYLLARDQVTSLLSSLSYKDHIITKLTDKMQTEGIELGKVFPSAMSSKSSRRTTSREELGKSVQGLAVFNEHEWRTQFVLGRDIPGSCRELLSRLSAQAGAFASTPINEQVEPDAWWERLSDGGHARDEEKEDSPQSPVRDSVKYETQVSSPKGIATIQDSSFCLSQGRRQVTPGPLQTAVSLHQKRLFCRRGGAIPGTTHQRHSMELRLLIQAMTILMQCNQTFKDKKVQKQ